MKVLVIVLFLKFSFTHSASNKSRNEDYFVKEKKIYSTPHVIVNDVHNSFVCSTRCSMEPACFGYTVETSTTKCLLFNYQTSNHCQNETDGNIIIQYVKPGPTDCSELPPDMPSGLYRVYPSRHCALLVYCEMTDSGGGWTVLQRRQGSTEDFYRDWADYKTGFGDLESEFWIGNDIIHDITSQRHYKVRFDLEAFNGQTAYAEYDMFYVADEDIDYGVNISGYSGTAGNGLSFAENFARFSTKDVDNDKASYSCATTKESGWWYTECAPCNINGRYKPGVSDHTTMHWRPWRGLECLRKTRMMIKPA